MILTLLHLSLLRREVEGLIEKRVCVCVCVCV